MAIQKDLIYFLKNGKLENINFGITSEQLVEMLGEPDFVNRNKVVDRYDYGYFEFYVWKEEWKGKRTERLRCIVANRPKLKLNRKNLRFKTHRWTIKLTFEEAINFLNKNEIKFIENLLSYTDEYRSLITESKVYIDFIDVKNDGNFSLFKFGREVELNSIKPSTKQVSFEIEEDYYKQLKDRAEKTKISIATLCREIVENHLENNK